MVTRQRKTGAVLCIILLSLGLPYVNFGPVFSAPFGGKIDVYTQNEPHSGKGENMPSDAFGPEDMVQIFAYVTYNDFPVGGVYVAFFVRGPINSVQNMSFLLAAATNDDGFASVSFRIPLADTAAFGEWVAGGSVRIGDVVVNDTVRFKVDWLVKILSATAVDTNRVTGYKFALGCSVGIEVALCTISMIPRSTTVTVTLFDAQRILVSSTESSGIVVPPNETVLYVYFFFGIPKNASVGQAIAYANSLTQPFSEGGVPYCPETTAEFLLVAHDVAVRNVHFSPATVFSGEIVSVDVCVENKGSEPESFQTKALYNGSLIDEVLVLDLWPASTDSVRFYWNTSNADQGFYRIGASVEKVEDEIDVSDNSLDDGFVEIRTRPPLLRHDVAVSSVVPLNTSVAVGDIVNVEAVVTNNGDSAESFNVSLLVDSLAVHTAIARNLEPSSTRSLLLFWNTTGTSVGNHTVGASASEVFGETNLGNNVYVDGSVEVKTGIPPAPTVHDVEVLSVVPSSSTVYVGQVVEVKVTVRNKGNATESFDVSLRYDQSAAGTSSIHNLPEGAQHTLTFRWNTTGVPSGNYRLSAYAEPVQGEENTADNGYVDGYVQLVSPEAGSFGFDWFYLFLLLLLIVLIVIFILLACLRRNRKENRKVFASGWTAWFYGYDSKDTSRSESKTRGRPSRQRRSDA